MGLGALELDGLDYPGWRWVGFGRLWAEFGWNQLAALGEVILVQEA